MVAGLKDAKDFNEALKVYAASISLPDITIAAVLGTGFSIQQNRINGVAFQNAVLKALGVEENKTPIRVDLGRVVS